MRKYETVFIANPDLSDEERQPLFDKLQNLISQGSGLVIKFDEWGHKRLAYEVKKQTRGYYVQVEFCGDGSLVNELERNLRLDDRVLKYMTVLQERAVDLEAIKAELKAAKEQEIQAAKEQEIQAAKEQEIQAAKEQELEAAAKEQEIQAAKEQELGAAAKEQELGAAKEQESKPEQAEEEPQPQPEEATATEPDAPDTAESEHQVPEEVPSSSQQEEEPANGVLQKT